MTEKKTEKKGLAPIIMALAALLTAGGAVVKDIAGNQQQELLQQSIFNYATTETAEIRERLARLEAHLEWLRSVEAGAGAAMLVAGDDDDDAVEDPPPPPPEPDPAPRKAPVFDDLKAFVQTEQRAWTE